MTKKNARTPPRNNVKALREAAGLTQRALGKKCGVSQQHINRIEHGAGDAIGFRLAVKLCAALKKPMVAVFPRTASALKGNGEYIDPQAMWRAGIEPENALQIIHLRLRGRRDMIRIPLADGERHRLWSLLQRGSEGASGDFVVFEGADQRRYVLNMRHLLGWHFLFEALAHVVNPDDLTEEPDPREGVPDEGKDKDEDDYYLGARGDGWVRIWFSDGLAPTSIDAEEDGPDEAYDTGRLEYLFSMLDGSDEGGAYSLMDNDGEVFWFLVEEVALLSAPEALIAGDSVDEQIEDDGLADVDAHDADETPAPSAEDKSNG